MLNRTVPKQGRSLGIYWITFTTVPNRIVPKLVRFYYHAILPLQLCQIKQFQNAIQEISRRYQPLQLCQINQFQNFEDVRNVKLLPLQLCQIKQFQNLANTTTIQFSTVGCHYQKSTCR